MRDSPCRIGRVPRDALQFALFGGPGWNWASQSLFQDHTGPDDASWALRRHLNNTRPASQTRHSKQAQRHTRQTKQPAIFTRATKNKHEITDVHLIIIKFSSKKKLHEFTGNATKIKINTTILTDKARFKLQQKQLEAETINYTTFFSSLLWLLQ